MAGETPRKRRHLGAALAFLLSCGVCFSIGAYVGASPTDPLGVRDILGVGNANVARPIAQQSTRAQTECPRPVKCEPPPRCEPKEIVREVQVERECPACEACPKVPEEAPEEAEEASEVLRFAASWGGREGEGKSLSLPDPPPLRAYFAYDPSLIGDANESEKNKRARDRFGEQMLLNLRARGCPLLGAEKTRGVAKHVERARRNGWEIAGAVDMLAASKRLAYENPSESRRVAFIEPLDELEEYELIQAHYVVSWGVRGADDDAARLERVVDRSSARRP